MAAFDFSDDYFMKEAIKEAEIAAQKDEVPIGAIIVCNNVIIARSHNLTEILQDVSAHAEILAYTSAASNIGAKYLTDCTLYVTLEPCAMCAAALAWAQLGRLVYGAHDERRGFSVYKPLLLHPSTIIKGGVLEEHCTQLITIFFKNKRKK